MSTVIDTPNPAAAAGHPRKPWVAVVLSVVVCGLGHIYCGRIVKGLVLLLIGGALGSLAIAPLVFGHASWAYYVLLAWTVLVNGVWLYAIVDAFFSARRVPPDYQLKDYNRWYVYVLLVLLMVPMGSGYALLIREGFCEAFRIAADSMKPTLKLNDRVLANKRIYRFEPVCRGDIVIFINPNKRQERWIKRVVALPGDTIQLRDNEVYVNGNKLPRTKSDDAGARIKADRPAGKILWEENDGSRYRILLGQSTDPECEPLRDVPLTTVAVGHCYVLGDNRNCSRDSRHVGAIPLVDVVGRVDYLYFPKVARLRP